MKPVVIHQLQSADDTPWKDGVARSDGLPARPSGPWIATKHKLLAHYAEMFATGMKNRWANRVYLELFSGPGRCLVRGSHQEDLGSPLKVIGHEFTKFIFTEMSIPAAQALATRLEPAPNASKVLVTLRPLRECPKVRPLKLTFSSPARSRACLSISQM